MKLRKIEAKKQSAFELFRVDKKGQGVVSNTFAGIVGLVLLLIIGFVFIDTLTGANLLTANGASANAVNNVTANLSAGVQNDLAPKIKTGVLIAAVVFLVSLLILLWRYFQGAGIGRSSI